MDSFFAANPAIALWIIGALGAVIVFLFAGLCLLARLLYFRLIKMFDDLTARVDRLCDTLEKASDKHTEDIDDLKDRHTQEIGKLKDRQQKQETTCVMQRAQCPNSLPQQLIGPVSSMGLVSNQTE